MKKQFGVVRIGREWRILSLHGDGNVLERGIAVSDHPTKAQAKITAQGYARSHRKIWPEDTVEIREA